MFFQSKVNIAQGLVAYSIFRKKLIHFIPIEKKDFESIAQKDLDRLKRFLVRRGRSDLLSICDKKTFDDTPDLRV